MGKKRVFEGPEYLRCVAGWEKGALGVGGGDKEGPGLLKDDLWPQVEEICEGLEGDGREGRYS